MKHSARAIVCLAGALALSTVPQSALSQDVHSNKHDDGRDSNGNDKQIVTVAFGVGLNTAQPGNALNHHVLPKRIKVKKGGVINFVVAGFHNIVVYKPGVRVEQIGVPTSGLFINDPNSVTIPGNIFYRGIRPAGGPPPGFPAQSNPSNAENRVEPVAFLESGTYLVICNVIPHFKDGMYAYIEVE
jgi:hypothetical protein